MSIQYTCFHHSKHDGHLPAVVLVATKKMWLHSPKTNIAPKNDGFQLESPFPVVFFQGLC